MIIELIGEIDKDMFLKFVEAKNKLPENEKLTIYFNSNGGTVQFAEAIFDIINSDYKNIILVGFARLYSCAFSFFLKAKCEKKILSETLGMFHQSAIQIWINESGKPECYSDVAHRNLVKTGKESTLQLCRDLKFTKTEINKIKSGQDVYFDNKRMQDFLSIKL